MKKLTKLLGIIAIGAVIAIGIAGCDNPAGGGGSDGGSIDSALVATWHLTQAAADNEEAPVFEIASDGSFIGSPGQENSPITITHTTANGRVSSTTTTGGTSVETGSAAYAVEGTRLTLSDLIGAPNIFVPLSTAGGVFYKKGSGNSGNGGAKTLVIQNIPADVYSYGASGGGDRSVSKRNNTRTNSGPNRNRCGKRSAKWRYYCGWLRSIHHDRAAL